MLTHNLNEFQLIPYYGLSTIDHFTVNSDSCLHNVLKCYQLYANRAPLFVLWVCEVHELVDWV